MTQTLIAPPAGSRCQEAGPLSKEAYVPCGAPAEFVVQGKDPCAYNMCAPCADHNVRNRGAHYVVEGEAFVPFSMSVEQKAEAAKAAVEAAAAAAAPAAPQLTIAQVQKAYIDTKDALEAMAKKHAEEMAPLNKRMELCKAWMLDYLNKSGLENAKTEFGQCYKSNAMSATVDPENGWEHLLTFIVKKALDRALTEIENGGRDEAAITAFLAEPSLALLNRSVNKTTVKELLDQDITVPGVKIATVTQLNVRRS